VANSAGLLGYKPRALANIEQWVRCGLSLYGYSPLPAHQPMLQPVLTWKAPILLVRAMEAGMSISYGRTFITPHQTRTATIAIGYADGYLRALSGKKADVLIAGVRCPVLGRVTMDQIVVDLSRVSADVVTGDEAVLIGTQGEETITANELAEKAGTIPYEVLTSIKAAWF
jgi:alanine racemase